MTTRGASHEDFDIFQDPSVVSSTLSHIDDPVDSADCDVPIKSIERSFSTGTHHHGALTPPHSSGPSGDEEPYGDEQLDDSHDFDDQISELPDEPSLISPTSSPCVEGKHRSPFRNPSSVRAMQLEHTPPPFNYSGLSAFSPPRHSSPRSIRSQQRDRVKPGQSPRKKEYPLILLHITLLPLNLPQPLEIMQEVLPPHVVENYLILRDKIDATTLDRGILIPHPREDYELLEERLLESLDLKLPRILKCGHFLPSADDALPTVTATDRCEDCERHIRDGPQSMTGEGCRRWTVQIYAANGLMRAGAWAAAWKEMERVDVEITPWVDEELRKALKTRGSEELERRRVKERDEQRRHSEERLREIYGGTPAPTTAAPEMQREVPLEEEHRQQTAGESRPRMRPGQQDIPITDLLRNYVFLLFQDSKNVVIAGMVVLVLTMALFGGQDASKGSRAVEVRPSALPVSTVTVTQTMAETSTTTASLVEETLTASAAVPASTGLKEVEVPAEV